MLNLLKHKTLKRGKQAHKRQRGSQAIQTVTGQCRFAHLTGCLGKARHLKDRLVGFFRKLSP